MDGKNRDFPTEIDWPSVSSINSLEDQMLDDYSDEWTEEEEEETVFETNDARIEEDPVMLTMSLTMSLTSLQRRIRIGQ